MSRITIVTAAFLLALFAYTMPATAKEDFPNKPIKVVVVTGAGSATDTITRLVSERAATLLGQPIVVENKPGASGIVATQYVKQAAADGYTLLVGGAYNLATAVNLIPNLGYDPLVDLAPVTRLFDVGYVLVVNPDFPAHTLQEFIDLVRENPRKFNYASIGNASTSHLTMEMFKAREGLQIVHVPYKTDAAALPDVVSGQVQAMFDPPSAVTSYISSRKLKALAYSGESRNSALPDVPLVSETVKDFASASWLAILAPAGTPQVVIEALNEAYVAAIDAPDIRDKISKLGATAVSSTPEELAIYMRDQIQKSADVIKQAHIKLN